MTFNKRRGHGEAGEKAFETWCNENNIEWAKSGIEQLIASDKFVKVIHELKDKNSERIRFFPDFVMLRKVGWLIEVKHAISIEKTAFDVYMNLHRIGHNVGLVIYMDNKLKLCPIDKLKIREYDDNDCSGSRIPMIRNSNGKLQWIAPRKITDRWTKRDYFEWKKGISGKGCGTTYGYIHFEKSGFEALNNENSNHKKKE